MTHANCHNDEEAQAHSPHTSRRGDRAGGKGARRPPCGAIVPRRELKPLLISISRFPSPPGWTTMAQTSCDYPDVISATTGAIVSTQQAAFLLASAKYQVETGHKSYSPPPPGPSSGHPARQVGVTMTFGLLLGLRLGPTSHDQGFRFRENLQRRF